MTRLRDDVMKRCWISERDVMVTPCLAKSKRGRRERTWLRAFLSTDCAPDDRIRYSTILCPNLHRAQLTATASAKRSTSIGSFYIMSSVATSSA